MLKDKVNQAVFQAAKDYLLSFKEIDEDILDKQLSAWENYNLSSLPSLFKAMLENAKNRQGMPNAIGEVSSLSGVLFDFNPKRVVDKYPYWEILFDEIKLKVRPPGRMVKNNPHNYWVVYSKSIISIARFVNRFKDYSEFREYVDQFVNSKTPDTRIALPLLLEKEIFGYQFALACDFLKENIDPHFIKTDTHIRDIFIGLGYSPEGSSDYQVFRDVIRFSDSIGELPYVVDKLFWLVGSGNFYDSGITIKASKRDFIRQTRNLMVPKK